MSNFIELQTHINTQRIMVTDIVTITIGTVKIMAPLPLALEIALREITK